MSTPNLGNQLRCGSFKRSFHSAIPGCEKYFLGILPYFGDHLFNISSVFLRKFFGNPSGVPAEISKVSRRTPEELANKTGMNTDLIPKKTSLPPKKILNKSFTAWYLTVKSGSFGCAYLHLTLYAKRGTLNA